MPEKKYKVGSDIYDIPEAKSGDFLKDFPDAVELETFTVGKDTFDIPIKEREAFLADFPDAKSVKKKFSSQVSGESAETSSQEQSPYKLETPEFDFNSMGSKFTPETPESVSLKELQYQPHAREFSTPELGVELPESKLGRETPGTLGEKYLRGEDIPRAEPPRLTTPVGDMLRSLKAGSMQTFGALAATPKMINDTLFDLVGRPIVKLMGATDEEAQYVNNYVINSLSGQAIGLTADAQAPLNKKAEETRKKMAVIEGNIWSNLNRGKDGERDLGAALELFGRGAMETVPFLIEVAATAGAGTIPILGVIAATTATQQYAETEGMEKNRRLNAWMYGGFEGLGELATGVIFRGIGKAFRSGMAKNLSPAHAKSIAKGIASAVGLESSSEAITQIGQNFTDIVTGRNLELSIFDNVPDAAILGGGLGIVGGGVKPLAAVVGRALASDKDVKSVQENFKQQSVLIDQLDKSGSESVKEALRNSIRQLNTQANELMDENYNLAQRLSEEERNQVTKLYAVAAELQTKIDSGELTPDESSALENTAKGIKDQIQTIKDNLVTRLKEEREAEKQAKVDAIKENEKAELDKIKEEESKKLEKAKNVKEGETVDKKKIDKIKEDADSKSEEIKNNTKGQLEKIEEEYKGKPIMDTSIRDMNSEQLRNRAKEIKGEWAAQEERFWGREGARKYREAQSVSNSSTATSEQRKQAYKVIEELESSLTKEQYDEMFGEKQYDPAELRDIALTIERIEEAESIEEIAGSLKNPLMEFKANQDNEGTLAILNAAKRRAVELNIDPKEMLASAVGRIAKDIPDFGDAKELIDDILKKLITGVEQPTQKQIPTSPVAIEQPPVQKPVESTLREQEQSFDEIRGNAIRRASNINLNETELPSPIMSDDVVRDVLSKNGIFVSFDNTTDTHENVAKSNGENITIPNNPDLAMFIHELAHVIDNELGKIKKQGSLSKDVMRSVTTYGARDGGEAFAENLKLFFLSPKTLKLLSPDVFVELEKIIPDKYMRIIGEILVKYNVDTDRVLPYNKGFTEQIEKEGTEDAESTGRKTKEGGEQPQELVEGEEERLHIRDDEKNGVETTEGEITPIEPVAQAESATITPEPTQTTTQEKGAVSKPMSETRPQEPDIDTKIKEVKNRLANNLENLMGAIGGIQEISGDQRANVIQILQDIIKDLAELTGLKGQQLYNRLKDELNKKGAKIADDIIDEAFKVSGNVTEPPVKSKVTDTGDKDTKYRKTQINSLIQDQTLQQQEVAKIVDANKETYTVMHQADAVAEAKALIDELGVQGASLELEKPTKSMADFPVRNVARMILLDFYSRAIVDRNASEQDKNTAFQHIDALQERMARENTKAGQGISMMKIWKAMQPAGVLEYVVRKLNKANETILKKKVGDSTLGEQLDELYTTLNEESRKIIEDILAGKEIKLSGKETKPPARRKTVPKERIKQEQDYRKNLLAQYKAEQGSTLSASVTGLTKEQMELGGNLLASYIREGYYRVQDLIDKLTEDFKSVGVDLTDEQKDEILTSPKTGNESFKDYSNKKETKANDRAAEKFIDKKVKEVIREHWNKDAKDELRRTLAQKLVDEAGLSEAEAKRIEGEILTEFDKKILERSQKQLTKVLGTEKIPVEKQRKGIVGKMIDLINLGALDEQLYRNLFAEKFKLVELTDAHKEQILLLASNVQRASGKGWLERDATIRLAKYIYELYPEVKSTVIQDTMMDLAYANMLMGISTSVLNLTSAGSNIALKPIRDVINISKWLRFVRRGVRGTDIYNPFGEMFYLPGLYGVQMGATEAAEVYKNGDLNNKYIEEVAKKEQFRVRQVERNKYGKGKRFKPITVPIGGKNIDLNIFNLYKYSGRNLAAQDKLMLTTSYELEIAKILRDKFRNTNLSGRALTKKVMETLRGEHIDMQALGKTLQEDATLYREMTGEEMTSTQLKIRRRELMMEELPLSKEEREEAETLARSNIFTDDRGGMIATAASWIGRLANYNSTAGMIVKPFVPFTKVVGNVVEYMLDHTPFYGLLRANGMSVSRIKKLIDSDMPTAQMGERGSRAYYEQMGRAWLGTEAFLLAMAVLLGTDEDDKFELSGGYNQEGFKKRGRENVLPPYTLRIGNVKIGYKNIPALAIPLSIIGNINDALKLKKDEAEIRDRMNAALLLKATQQSVFMVKDMSFVEGMQRLTGIITDFASSDEKKIADVGENIIKSYIGFLTRPMPQNNNAVQQIWRFFDPTSYSQSDIQGILAYSVGLQHFVGRPSLDQFGEPIKSYPAETLMPYTHWLKIKGEDERWKFLAKYNAIPNKLYNRVMRIEEADGLHPRKMEPDELFEYTQRTGQLFSKYLTEYMSDKERTDKRAEEFIDREKSNGDTERISGIREDVEKLWADARSNAEMELFRWGIVKEEMPSEWALIKKHGAYQLWQGSKSIDSYNLTPKELYTFNSYASLRYAEKVQSYLRSDKIDSDKKSGKFQKKIDDMWADAKEYATKKVARELKNQVNK